MLLVPSCVFQSLVRDEELWNHFYLLAYNQRKANFQSLARDEELWNEAQGENRM